MFQQGEGSGGDKHVILHNIIYSGYILFDSR